MVSSPTGPPSNFSMIARSSLAVQIVQTLLIHLQQRHSVVRHLRRDVAVGAYLRVVAHPAQQPQRYARRAPCPAGDLLRAVVGDGRPSAASAARRTISCSAVSS